MSCIPPDSNGSGASPAEPDQPPQAPPRPATNGSSAVTRPPGLRCQRVVPSGSVTWSTGSRLATTTTGLSAGTCPPLAVPPLLVIPDDPIDRREPRHPGSGDRAADRPAERDRSEARDQRDRDVGDREEPGARLQQPQRFVTERAVRGQGAAQAGAQSEGERRGDRVRPAGEPPEQEGGHDVDRQRAPGEDAVVLRLDPPVGEVAGGCADPGPQRHPQPAHAASSPRRPRPPTARASTTPRAAASRAPTAEPTRYRRARSGRPSPINSGTSTMAVEKVVNPPSTPTPRNGRSSRCGAVSSSVSSTMSAPSRNEPARLMPNVVTGQAPSPAGNARSRANRASVPATPPSAMTASTAGSNARVCRCAGTCRSTSGSTATAGTITRSAPRLREEQIDEARRGRLRLVVGQTRALVGLDEDVVGAVEVGDEEVDPGHRDPDRPAGPHGGLGELRVQPVGDVVDRAAGVHVRRPPDPDPLARGRDVVHREAGVLDHLGRGVVDRDRRLPAGR